MMCIGHDQVFSHRCTSLPSASWFAVTEEIVSAVRSGVALALESHRRAREIRQRRLRLLALSQTLTGLSDEALEDVGLMRSPLARSTGTAGNLQTCKALGTHP